MPGARAAIARAIVVVMAEVPRFAGGDRSAAAGADREPGGDRRLEAAPERPVAAVVAALLGRLADARSGGEGNDLLFGNQGDDSLDGGAGNNTLDGGGGINTCVN